MSNNTVQGLMVSHKYGLVHKPIADGPYRFMLWPPGFTEKKVLGQSVHPEQPCKRVVLFFVIKEQQANIQTCSKHNIRANSRTQDPKTFACKS
jgi:hypothetical protein